MLQKSKPSSGDRVIIEGGEEVILIKPIDEKVTYIDDNLEYPDDDPRESNPLVLVKQRWQVDKVEMEFGREKYFRCNRYIRWVLGSYCRIVTKNGEDFILRKNIQ